MEEEEEEEGTSKKEIHDESEKRRGKMQEELGQKVGARHDDSGRSVIGHHCGICEKGDSAIGRRQ